MSMGLFIGIGLVIGLVGGIGIGFGIFGTYGSESDSQVLDAQQFRQMMLDDPDSMQNIILSTMPDSDQMQMMEDMMKDLMQRMQTDPELKKAMMEHMDRMKTSKESMMDNQMMDGMMIGSSMMKQTSNQTMSMSSIDFSNIRITQISDTGVTIEGDTDQPVFCQVEYGTDGLFTNFASDGMDMMGMLHYKHEVIISDLEPNTSYNYRFKASIGNQTFYSETKTLMTE